MTKKSKEDLAQKIKIYMLKKGISQRDLSKRLKVTPQTVSKLLMGNTHFRTDTLNKIAAALGTSANYFFDNSSDVSGNNNIVQNHVGEAILQQEIQLIKKELEAHRYKLENLELKIEKIQKK